MGKALADLVSWAKNVESPDALKDNNVSYVSIDTDIHFNQINFATDVKNIAMTSRQPPESDYHSYNKQDCPRTMAQLINNTLKEKTGFKTHIYIEGRLR